MSKKKRQAILPVESVVRFMDGGTSPSKRNAACYGVKVPPMATYYARAIVIHREALVK